MTIVFIRIEPNESSLAHKPEFVMLNAYKIVSVISEQHLTGMACFKITMSNTEWYRVIGPNCEALFASLRRLL